MAASAGTDGLQQVGWAGGHARLGAVLRNRELIFTRPVLDFPAQRPAVSMATNRSVAVRTRPAPGGQHARLIWHGNGSLRSRYSSGKSAGFDQSYAIATDGIQQVGVGSNPSPNGRADSCRAMERHGKHRQLTFILFNWRELKPLLRLASVVVNRSGTAMLQDQVKSLCFGQARQHPPSI